jgi:hypothetical protein
LQGQGVRSLDAVGDARDREALGFDLLVPAEIAKHLRPVRPRLKRQQVLVAIDSGQVAGTQQEKDSRG